MFRTRISEAERQNGSEDYTTLKEVSLYEIPIFNDCD